MTKENFESFKSSTKCWICDNPFAEYDAKVRDQRHFSGKYNDATHDISLIYNIPIVFHNLKSYEAHVKI